MNQRTFEFIQNQIGYTFKNRKLLEQAFIKSSDNPVVNYEVLEFYGDKILAFMLSKKLFSENSNLSLKGNFLSSLNAGMLSSEFVKYSNNNYLAKRIEELRLAPFLIKHHYNKKYSLSKKTVADLFEALLGAVAVDCNWNVEILERLTERMLLETPDETCGEKEILEIAKACKIGQIDFYTDEVCSKYRFTVRFSSLYKEFSETSKKLNLARATACRKAADYINFVLNENLPEDLTEFEKLDLLARMNYIPSPEFYFHTEEVSEKERWFCECSVRGFDCRFVGDANTYEGAKRIACSKMLDFALNTIPSEAVGRQEKAPVELSEDEEQFVPEENHEEVAQDYVSRLYDKANRKEIDRPEFAFEEKADGFFICIAKINEQEWRSEAETNKQAKQDVCKKILEEIEQENEKYFA